MNGGSKVRIGIWVESRVPRLGIWVGIDAN